MAKKVSYLLVLLGLTAVAGILAFQTAILEQETKELQAELLEKPEADEQLQEQLNTYYEKEQKKKEDKQELQVLVERFLAAVYQAPVSEYGPVPYVQEYLTDEGIRSLISQIDPVAYNSLTEEELQAIRSGKFAEQKNSVGTAPKLLTQELYTDISEDGLSADILLFADCGMTEGGSLPTFSILLQVACTKGSEGWRINELGEFRQL